MKAHYFLALLLLPQSSFAFFGTMGRDQCAYPTSSFATSYSDYNHARQVQVLELEGQKRQLESQMARITTEMGTFQGYLSGYFSSPWLEAMQAHMDNGLDCCSLNTAGSTSTVAALLNVRDRRPAGNEVIETQQPPTYTEPVDRPTPAPVNPLPPESSNPVVVAPTTTPPAANSCHGYSSNYCSSTWTHNNPPVPPAGAQCLQTGFAATPAWYYGACRNAGEIDPQVCTHPQITGKPNEYQQCIQALGSYRSLTAQKRQMSGNIAQINIQIQALMNPNRPSGGSEVTSGASSVGLSNLLGFVSQMVLPVFNQYRNYQNEMDYSNRRPSYYQGMYSRNQMGPPAGATYFGPTYGYGFSYGGNYGSQPPAYQTGGFGCSTGLFGSGMNIVGQLFGGIGNSFRGGLGATFGMGGGGVPSGLFGLLYGNQYPNVPSHRFGGYTPPYQVGGIYGVPPAGATIVNARPPTQGQGYPISQHMTGGTAYPRPPISAVPGYSNAYGPPIGSTGGGYSAPSFGGGYGAYGTYGSNGYNLMGSGGYQSSPYFGNMAGMLSSLFSGQASLQFNANARLGLGW